jgi:hypothetical protein
MVTWQPQFTNPRIYNTQGPTGWYHVTQGYAPGHARARIAHHQVQARALHSIIWLGLSPIYTDAIDALWHVSGDRLCLSGCFLNKDSATPPQRLRQCLLRWPLLRCLLRRPRNHHSCRGMTPAAQYHHFECSNKYRRSQRTT